MGGCLCLHLLRESLPLKVIGLFCLSSFLIESSIIFKGSELTPSIPLLMMHGTKDALIKYSWGEATGANLAMMGVDVQFRKFENLDHELRSDELSNLMYWMLDLIHLNNGLLETSLYTKRSMEVVDKKSYEGGGAEILPFSIKMIDESNGKYEIRYPCPAELIDTLCARQVLARLSCFDITPSGDGKGVQSIVLTKDPEGTAYEIGVRLFRRVQCGAEDA